MARHECVEGNTFFGQSSLLNNTYKTVRVVGEEYDLAYTVWCTNEHELYDMTVCTIFLLPFILHGQIEQ